MEIHVSESVSHFHSRSERVEKWVKHAQEFHQKHFEENCGKRKRAPSIDDLTNSDVDGYSDDLVIWETPQTESRKKYRWNKLPLILKCEWFSCTFKISSIEEFVKHVSYHIPEVNTQIDGKNNGNFICQWYLCDFRSSNGKEFVRHVNFHSYHTKLKSIGVKMVQLLNIPKCNLNFEGRNSVPELPVEFLCEWEDCSRTFNNSQMFFFHVASHLSGYRGRRSRIGKIRDIPCGWLGCSARFYSICKLSEHLRVHTQEKLAACPYCGGLFSSPTKLYDHCTAQISAKPELRCTSCFKHFPSERLLRDHMRRHVNRFKCSFCDMTCPSPSSLSVHIRYRHLNSKPFKCCFCSFAVKTQRDLEKHLNTHSSTPDFSCPVDDCGYTCRSLVTINKHVRDLHCGGSKPVYCCHICSDRFYKGSQLTKHLFKYHNFQWSSGHSRFTYTRNEDGYFRLKPFRLETLEVTQEILQAEIDEHPGSISEVCGSHYSVQKITPKEIEDGVSGSTKGISRKRKTIVISIDEIDKTGGIVRREIMETEEVPSQRRGGAVVWNYSDEDVVNSLNIESYLGKS